MKGKERRKNLVKKKLKEHQQAQKELHYDDVRTNYPKKGRNE